MADVPGSSPQAQPSTPTVAVPVGLREVNLSWKVPTADLDYARALTYLTTLDGFDAREDLGVRGLVHSDDQFPGMHGHFFLGTAKKERHQASFEVYTSGTKSETSRSATLSAFMESFASLLADRSKRYQALVGARYALGLDEWEPTVGLPYTPSASFDAVPGRPKIAGVDFEFDDKAQPLRRAFVSTLSPQGELVIQFLLAKSVVLGRDSLPDMLSAAAETVPIFVKPRAKSG